MLENEYTAWVATLGSVQKNKALFLGKLMAIAEAKAIALNGIVGCKLKCVGYTPEGKTYDEIPNFPIKIALDKVAGDFVGDQYFVEISKDEYFATTDEFMKAWAQEFKDNKK